MKTLSLSWLFLFIFCLSIPFQTSAQDTVAIATGDTLFVFIEEVEEEAIEYRRVLEKNISYRLLLSRILWIKYSPENKKRYRQNYTNPNPNFEPAAPSQNFASRKKYKAWVTKKDQTTIKNLGLYRVMDEEVILAPIGYWEEIPFGELSKTAIPFSEIESICLKNKNSSRKGILAGTLAGITTGIVSGFKAGDIFKEECHTTVNDPCLFAFFSPCFDPITYTTSCETVLVKKAEIRAIERGLGYGVIGGLLGYLAGSGFKIRIGLSNKEKSLEELTRYSYFRE